jgi:hypothetical protein
MDYKALYKGSQYVAVWIVLYLVVKYALGAEVSEIDAALTASVLTLLLLITENMLYLRNSSRDYVKEQVESQKREGFEPNGSSSEMTNGVATNATNGNGNANDVSSDILSGAFPDLSSDVSSDVSSDSSDVSSMSSDSSDASSLDQDIQRRPPTNSSQITGPLPREAPPKPGNVPINNIPVIVPNNADSDISGVSSYDDSSDVSSDMTDAPNPSAGATNVPDIMRNIKVGDSTTPGMNDPNMKLDLPAGSVYDKTHEQNGDTTVYYSKTDYLGEQVILDRNEFGGTNDDPVVFKKNQSFGISHSEPQVAGVDSDGLDKGSNVGAAAVTPAQASEGVVKSNNVIMMPHTVSSADTGMRINVPMAPKMREAAPGEIMADMGNPTQTTVDRTGETKWYEQKFDPRHYTGAENLDQIAVSGGRTRNDLLVNQYKYSDFNRMPPSFNADDFEYGYSYLPPRDWYPLPPYPPVCVSNSTCPVNGVYLDTMTMDLKEWRDTQKITPPDSINTAFITNEMNSKA